MFYHYSQNNSGGSFHFDKAAGITVHVVVEADSAQEADTIAEHIGLYFDGSNDCECCGARWDSAVDYGDCGKPQPSVYDKVLGQKVTDKYGSIAWMKEGCETVVHFKNGVKQWYNADCTFSEEC